MPNISRNHSLYDYNDSVGDDVMRFYFVGTNDNDTFHGGPNDDIIKGGKGVDALYGEDGSDHIYGGADNDWLFGGDEQDHLFGGDGRDVLVGGAGNDVLVGGADKDWLTGGSGYDEFQINWEHLFKHDSPTSQPDEIMDFNINEDVIALQGTGPILVPGEYVEDTIDYGAGYQEAKEHALSLLVGTNKQYAFVTDGVDGYLFIEVYPNDVLEDVEIGVVLKGLTSLSQFDGTVLLCI
jgi:RTX calcium-binding nonapeptide repeat (4 copies)